MWKQTAFHKDSVSGLLSSPIHCPLPLRWHRSFHQDGISSVSSVQWVLFNPSLSANSRCLQEHKLYFKLQCRERQNNTSDKARAWKTHQDQQHGFQIWVYAKFLTLSREIIMLQFYHLIMIYFPHYILGVSPCCHILSHLCNNANPLHRVNSNESQLLQASAQWGNTEWQLLKMKIGTVWAAYWWERRAKERDRLFLFSSYDTLSKPAYSETRHH